MRTKLRKSSAASTLAKARWSGQDQRKRSLAMSRVAKGRMKKMTASDRHRVAVQGGKARAKSR